MAPTPRHDGPPPGVHEDGQPAPSSPEADALATLHSLHVHQEELRLQNEELQAARADLAASLRRYVDLFELSPVGLATLQPSGLVREVNRRGRELLPMMSKSGLGPPLPDLVCASSRDTLHSAIGDTARRARPRHVEVSVPTSSGEQRILSIDLLPDPGNPGGVLAAMTDVTLRRHAERELSRMREILELSNQVARIGWWECDVASGRMTWSHVTSEIHGVPNGSVNTLEAAMAFLTEGESRETLRRAWDAAVQDGRPFDLELTVRNRQEHLVWIRQIGLPDMVDGRCVRLHGTLQDVTERIAAEQARMDQARTEAASRSKTAFLARMSHELRTPLNAVLGFSQLLELDARVHQSPDLMHKVNHIHHAGKHLLDMIDEVLEFARVDSGMLKVNRLAVALKPLVAECLDLMQPLARQRGVELSATPFDDSMAVTGDALRLRQVVLNLLSNAVKYNRPGGLVALQVTHEPEHLLLTVRDSGLGLTPEQLASLFQPFNRLGAELSGIEGTGLNLVIVRQFVEAMGGSIQVESTPGSGSVFAIRLLRSLEAPILGGAPRHDDLAREGGAIVSRVLCIEDNPVNAELVRLTLQGMPNVSLMIAEDGPSGLAAVKRMHPDLVLMDMQLPGMSGLQVMAQMQADPVLARIPCVAVSADALASSVQGALEAGFVHYLVKPFSIDDLKSLVARWPGSTRGSRPQH